MGDGSQSYGIYNSCVGGGSYSTVVSRVVVFNVAVRAVQTTNTSSGTGSITASNCTINNNITK